MIGRRESRLPASTFATSVLSSRFKASAQRVSQSSRHHSHLLRHRVNITTMSDSSPASRRTQRSSANNTPRRSQRGSQVPRSAEPASDPPLPENEETNSQANGASSRNATPRASQTSNSQSQAPPTSSPLFFRSSPAGSQSQSQSQSLGVPAGRGSGSSPLRQRNDAATPTGLSSAGGRTPRANGAGIGGECQIWVCRHVDTDDDEQTLHPSITPPVQILQVQYRTVSANTERALLDCLYVLG